MKESTYFDAYPELASLYDGADYVDHKTIESNKTLREFLAGFIYYTPDWLLLLYKLRQPFVRLLGIDSKPADMTPVKAEDISFTPGNPCQVFTVLAGREEDFLAVYAEEKHLRAELLVGVEPLNNGSNRFHVGIIVHYRHWTGPIYFSVVRPLHHIVTNCMMRAGAK